MKVCYIFAAGEYDNILFDKAIIDSDFIIAADGGYSYLKQNNILPDLAVGDFDSLCFIPKDVEVIQHPCEKDDTDMALAVNEGFRRGYNCFVIYGGLGGRLDHTLANIQTLQFIAKNNGRGFLCNKDTIVTSIYNNSIKFSRNNMGTVSIFCLDKVAKGVTIKGLKYEVCDAELNSSTPLGVSNEFINKEAEITVIDGCLTIIYNNSCGVFNEQAL